MIRFTLPHRYPSLVLAAAVVLLVGCTAEPDVTYGLLPLELNASNAEKDRVKSIDQWITILHADLFGEALGSAELFEVKQAFYSVGDQEIACAVLVSNFMQDDNVQLPDAAAMTQDPDAFIDDTYVRFLVRYPTEAERTWMRNFLASNPTMTPELVYTSFALSEEYLHY
jgi:hypothetical protein